MAKWKHGGYFAAVIGTAIVVYAIFFGYYTRTKTFWLTYFPDSTYQPENSMGKLTGTHHGDATNDLLAFYREKMHDVGGVRLILYRCESLSASRSKLRF